VLRAISASLKSSEPSAPPLAGAEGAFVEAYPAARIWSATGLHGSFLKYNNKPASWKENLIASAAALLQPAKLAFRSIEIAVQMAGQESSLAASFRTPRVNRLSEDMYDDENDELESLASAWQSVTTSRIYCGGVYLPGSADRVSNSGPS
jgi:hypothetical protein